MIDLDLLKEIANAVVRGDERAVEELCREAVKAGIPPRKVITEGLSRGLRITGKKYERGEFSLADLLLSSEAMRRGLEHSLAFIKPVRDRPVGRCVVGVVRGNIHDLAKSILIALLRASGFEVHDLGVNVYPSQFVEAARKFKPCTLMMSVYTSNALPIIGEVEQALRVSGLKKEVKTMVGGAAASPSVAEKYGVDAYAKDVVEAVDIAKGLIRQLAGKGVR